MDRSGDPRCQTTEVRRWDREERRTKQQKEDKMTSLPDFYAGRSVFITGATGFMGKVLLEKILRSCPAVNTLYLLVRPKKGQAPQARVDQILQTKLFEKVTADFPDFRSKVVPVAGDILEPGLGLSQDDLHTLLREVSIVFHSAATVKFDEQLKLSIQMNVLGVKELLHICQGMPQLEAFVHVSTAYANCDRDEIQESVYPPAIHPDKLLDSVEWMSVGMLDTLTPSMVKPRPNTYTYTKSLAEYLVVEEATKFPICIVRPSIVGASWQEPFPGWVDNFNGPTGLLAAIGKGILRTMHGDIRGTADIIPVDIATNLMLASAWSTAIERPETIKVYNCTSGQLNPITWGQLERASYKFFMKNPLDEVVRIPNPRFTSSYVWRVLNVWFDHLLPAWIMDLGLRASGKQPVLTRLQNRLWKSVNCLEYFTSKEWHFSNANMLELLGKLNETDRKEFNFDVREVHWQTYLENYCMGTKRYALKEDLAGMPQARKNIQRTLWRHRVIKTIVFVLGLHFLVSRVSVVRGLWDFLLSWVLRIVKRLPAITKS